MLFISSLFIGLFVPKQGFSNPASETVEKFAQAGGHHQHPQNIPVVPGNPLVATAASVPPAGKTNNTAPPLPNPAHGKKLQPQDMPPQLLEDIPTSLLPTENLNSAATPPPVKPSYPSANRQPQNVAKESEKMTEMIEIFDYSAKVIIFYKPCENLSAPCRRPLMTNRKDIMFRYDKNRNINVSGIADHKKEGQTTNPPDSPETTQIN